MQFEGTIMDSLGDRVKYFEKRSETYLDTKHPILARIDGRSFHMFTRKMKRPFDETLTDSMVATAIDLVSETGAIFGYVQSDEITLAWSVQEDQEMWFGGRLQKMVSSLSAFATSRFYKKILDRMPEFAYYLPTFDARAWNVVDQVDVLDALLWRQRDAMKNSISQVASVYFTHNQLLNKHGNDKIKMLREIGIDWYGFDKKFTNGTFIRANRVTRKFTCDEIQSLPPLHNARKNPELEFERTEIEKLYLNQITDYKNAIDIVFNGEVPLLF